MAKRLVSRRNFLRNASCAALGSTTLMNTLTNLKFMNSAVAVNGFTDYKAMVVLLMGGGNDAYNMLIPYDDTSHAQYSATRTNLALPKFNTYEEPADSGNFINEDLRPLNYTDDAGKEFAVHYAMPNIQSLFQSGNLSFVANVGTLVQPTTKTQVYDGTTQLPLGLYSHADQVMHWQTGIPQERVAQGWGGKIADMFNACNDNENISLNLSLSGSNVYQTGQNTVEFSLNTNGATELEGISEEWQIPTARRNTINSMIDQYYDDIFKKTYVDIMRVGKDGAEEYNDAIDAQTLTTAFSGNRLSQQFELIAKTISARDTLGMKRQIFFVDFGGFDMHDEVLNTHEGLLSEIDTALGEFSAAMTEIQMQDSVTTFCLSEFARTLTSNGQGSDHAWGSNAFIMGGAVNGGQVFGTYPDLDLNNNLELGGGVMLPTIATDQYFGDIASWFGVENSELLTLFPNIDNFDSIYNGNPLGLLI